MTQEQKLALLQEFTQQVYLTIFNRRIKDITSAAGIEEIEKVVIWCNLFLDELEQETDPDGMPINWIYLRENDKEIGTIAAPTDTFDLPTGALRPVADPDRPLYIAHDGAAVSIWDVVDPNQITKRNDYYTRPQRVTYVNQKLVFSRRLNDTEIDGTVYADIVNRFTRLVYDTSEGHNVDLFALPVPRQLLVLGTAKNASLPDIVQGGLSPSYAQKFSALLDGHKAANMQSSEADEAVTDDHSGIGGVW